MASTVALLQQILVCHQQILQYYIDTNNLLEYYLPQALHLLVVRSAVDLSLFARKQALIAKYLPQLALLAHPKETTQVFRTIHEFVLPDLRAIDREATLRFSQVASDPVLLTIMAYLYPQLFLRVVEYFITGMKGVLRELMTALAEDVPQGDAVKQQLCQAVDHYKQIYPEWAAAQLRLFALLLQKDLLYDPKVNVMVEGNYRNEILAQILHNEVLASPHLFSSRESDMVDLMEVLTFHLDLMLSVTSLVHRFSQLTEAKLKYGHTHLQLPAVKRWSWPELEKVCNHLLELVVSELIRNGSPGLVEPVLYDKVVQGLAMYAKELQNYAPPALPTRLPAEILFRDELYFIEVMERYVEATRKFVGLVAGKQPRDFTGGVREEFDEFDTIVKDCFFDLLHFDQRFLRDEEVVRHMQQL